MRFFSLGFSALCLALAVLTSVLSECAAPVTILEDLDLSYQLTFSGEKSAQLWSETFFNCNGNTFRFCLAILVLKGSVDPSLGICSKLFMHICISWVIFLTCKMGIIAHLSSNACDMFSAVTGILSMFDKTCDYYEIHTLQTVEW